MKIDFIISFIGFFCVSSIFQYSFDDQDVISMSVLILTLPGDVHALATRWAIRQLGGSADIIYPADLCNGATWSHDPNDAFLEINYLTRQQKVDLRHYSSVWMRRPATLFPKTELGDRVEQANTEGEFAAFARSVYLSIERGRFVVNKIESNQSASLKSVQTSTAAQVGLNVPRTLISNSPEAILKFYEDCGGRVIFKPFRSALWHTDSGLTMIPISSLTLEILQGSDLSSAPGIFQELIDKHSEVRVTVMGRSIFAWEKRFNDRDGLHVDWSFIQKDAIFSPHVLPKQIACSLIKILNKLDIVFGCIDLILDKYDRYYFVEINPQGQWLWGDSLLKGMNQLEAMAQFLITGGNDFTYQQRDIVSYSMYKREVEVNPDLEEEKGHFGSFTDLPYFQSSFKV